MTKYYKNEKIISGERIVEVNLADESYEYISGHIIDRRNLLPATGYLFLMWQTLGMMRDKSINELPVVFENVIFQRATTIPKNESVLLTLMIQKCLYLSIKSFISTVSIFPTIQDFFDIFTL